MYKLGQQREKTYSAKRVVFNSVILLEFSLSTQGNLTPPLGGELKQLSSLSDWGAGVA